MKISFLLLFVENFSELWDFTIFKTKGNTITFGEVFMFGVAFWLLSILSFSIFRPVFFKTLVRLKINPVRSRNTSRTVSYLLFAFGAIIVLQNFGIDMSTFKIIGGAVGIGIGFGLKNITNNFISGIIIFLEKPIKVGDRVDLDQVQGNVDMISFRYTRIVTNDNIAIIVPNSHFIDSIVTNWSHNEGTVRIHVPIGVAYKEDPEHVKRVLLEVADSVAGVLKTPVPIVIFTQFGGSSMNFELLVCTDEYMNKPGLLKSQINFAVHARFKAENIEIPFPQTDIYIKETPYMTKIAAADSSIA